MVSIVGMIAAELKTEFIPDLTSQNHGVAKPGNDFFTYWTLRRQVDDSCHSSLAENIIQEPVVDISRKVHPARPCFGNPNLASR
jgi:hypothetical protein